MATPPVRDATVLWADLQGYHRLARAVGPGELLALLNRLWTAVTPALLRSGGIVAGYQGDAMFAHFGAVTRMPDHAVRAVKAGIAFQISARSFRAKAGRDLEFCVGIASGPVAVGRLGAGRAAKPTVLGATVNTAALLANLRTPGRVLVSRATRDVIARTHQLLPHPPLRYADHEVEVYEVRQT